MTLENTHWIASAGKPTVSLLALIILERGLVPNGMNLNDLDNHEKLIEILPEFRHGSGSLVTKIIEGFEPHLNAEGKKVPILRDVKKKVTLRMLLTHTAGLSYAWNNPLIDELCAPKDGSVPCVPQMSTGAIDAFVLPCVYEPGTTVSYGPSADWVGQFVVRSTGKNLRVLLHDYIFKPLDISTAEIDAALTTAITSRLSTLYLKLPEDKFQALDLPLYSEEGDPAPGFTHNASIPVWTSTQAFSKILQAIVRHDPKLLSEATWRLAEQDALEDTGIKMPVPRDKSVTPTFNDIVYFATPADPAKASSMNLLQCDIAIGPTLSGRPAGSYGWAGAGNSFFAVDPVNHIGYMYGAQVLPFLDADLVKLRDDLEKLIYELYVK